MRGRIPLELNNMHPVLNVILLGIAVIGSWLPRYASKTSKRSAEATSVLMLTGWATASGGDWWLWLLSGPFIVGLYVWSAAGALRTAAEKLDDAIVSIDVPDDLIGVVPDYVIIDETFSWDAAKTAEVQQYFDNLDRMRGGYVAPPTPFTLPRVSDGTYVHGDEVQD